MEKHNIPQLEAKIKELRAVCESVGDDSDVVELLKILHRPGWTTPAEFIYANSIVESLTTRQETSWPCAIPCWRAPAKSEAKDQLTPERVARYRENRSGSDQLRPGFDFSRLAI